MGVLGSKDSIDPADQYERYERLPVLLKRFSFAEKMRIACIYSSHAIGFDSKNRHAAQPRTVLPWCIETFVMLAMEAKEYQDGDFTGKNESKFIKMCNAIWSATSILAEKTCGRFSSVDLMLPIFGLTQFQLQEMESIKRFRYWRIFNDNSSPVHLKKTFKEKMGTDYEDFLLLGSVLQVLFYAQGQNGQLAISQKAFRYLIDEKFPLAAQKLIITRADYISRQKFFINDDSDPYKYVFSLCPSTQHPLIEHNGAIYFPLPHMLTQSVTSSLLYRITEGNDQLRTDVGKHIWERYLLDTIKDTGLYDEVYAEQAYRHLGSNANSPDVLARQGNSVLFMDSKSTVPALGLRIFDSASYEKNIAIVADYMVKLYKQILRFSEYNPFSGNVSSNTEDYWGIVVVLEDSYIRRQYYYERAKNVLELEDNSPHWKWFLTHIKVASLYEVERLCLVGKSIVDACKVVFQEDPYTFAFLGYPDDNSPCSNTRFLEFKAMYDQKIHALLAEMNSAGCFDFSSK